MEYRVQHTPVKLNNLKRIKNNLNIYQSKFKNFELAHFRVARLYKSFGKATQMSIFNIN